MCHSAFIATITVSPLLNRAGRDRREYRSGRQRSPLNAPLGGLLFQPDQQIHKFIPIETARTVGRWSRSAADLPAKRSAGSGSLIGRPFRRPHSLSLITIHQFIHLIEPRVPMAVEIRSAASSLNSFGRQGVVGLDPTLKARRRPHLFSPDHLGLISPQCVLDRLQHRPQLGALCVRLDQIDHPPQDRPLVGVQIARASAARR